MAAIRRSDTQLEVAVRARLHRDGLRFRKDLLIRTPTARVRPDIVFTRRRVAVFIDGCFWHCCPEHGRQPRQNVGYWNPKLARNAERDREQTRALEDYGWTVLRFWGHEPADSIAMAIQESMI